MIDPNNKGALGPLLDKLQSQGYLVVPEERYEALLAENEALRGERDRWSFRHDAEEARAQTEGGEDG